MAEIHQFPASRTHARSGFKKASIDTEPPERALSRAARPREASRRPAKMLRKCASEQSAAAASSPIDIPAETAQRAIGCKSVSDMAPDISARNGKSQDTIFPAEMVTGDRDLLKSGMAKRNPPAPREIFLGEWLEQEEIGPTEAAKIAGCSQSYISNISRGARPNINALYLLRLSEHLGISMNDFFRRPPSKAEIATLSALSPEAQQMLLRPKRQKRG